MSAARPESSACTATVAVVPALNEQLGVGKTIAALLCAGVGRVVVVDDGSTDSTSREAADAGAVVLRRERTGGKGAAVADGLARVYAAAGAGEMSPGCVVLADADLGESAREMEKVWSPVVDGRAQMAIAGFPAARGGGLGLAVGLARTGIRCLCGVNLTWPLSGQRAVRADTLFHLLESGMRLERGFGFEVGFTIDWLRARHSLIEVPTLMTHRATGRTVAGFAHRGRQFAAVARALAVRI